MVADRRPADLLPGLMAALPDGRRLVLAAGERSKRLRAVERLLEAASAMGAERGDAWVGVGGGTTTDVVGAAAALYLRGVPFVALPTTWLGMTDAAIGGKVGVDLSAAKNAAGAFWPPVAIVGDLAALRTLPRARRLDGMAESLKAGLIGDPGLWQLVETRGRAALRDDEAARFAIIDRSVRLKLGVVDRDPFEQGERRAASTWATPSGMPWRSRAATACRTARRSCWACAPWPPSPPGGARRRAWRSASMPSWPASATGCGAPSTPRS